ncbi:MAG: DegT/DnrJ/EryC1/StrS family aminotransferase [Nitrosarchaeum sp.]|nr:DegT/DnrJ/EryC1/StrS family aminotransferase [Nitrosarchaeum sp.]
MIMKVPYYVPWITDNDRRNVQKSLKQRWLTDGPFLDKFENKFRQYIDVKFSSGVGSATQALHLSMRALGLSPGDEVIVPTFTFASTANAVLYCGAKPILTDVDSETFNISPKEIVKNITKKTKAIIVVHYGGQSCDMNEILSIGKKYKLKVIEDCAHALGSTFKNKKCGSIGLTGCFSFYPTKIITTGEGGMVTTNDKSILNKVNNLKSQGMSIQAKERETKAVWKYDIIDLGYNYRLDEIRSSLGLSQLNRVTEINQKRIRIAQKYNKLIKKINGLSIPIKKSDRNHIYHLYTIKVEKEYPITRDELFANLFKKGIGTSVQYYPLHLMSLYQQTYKNKKHGFPVANELKDKILCLPIYAQMTDKAIQYVVSNLK